MPSDRTVIVVGDGPTGLSAALFLAKNGLEVDVVGANATPTHKAMLHNYLGLDGVPGPDFVATARDHAERYGARLHKAAVQGIEAGDRFRVRTPERTFEADYLVLATGFDRAVAQALGLEAGPDGVRVDHNGRTSRDKVYAGGALARGKKSQVATSVGDGAAIALDVLSREEGKPTHDWDVIQPKPEAPRAHA